MFSFCPENLGKEIYSKGAGSWKKRHHFQASSSTLLVVVLISRIATIFGRSWHLKFLLKAFYSGREKKTDSIFEPKQKTQDTQVAVGQKSRKQRSLFHEKRLGLDHQASQVPTNRKGRRMFCINPTPANVAVKRKLRLLMTFSAETTSAPATW